MSLTLKEITATLLNELQSANVSADINREHLREIYENSPLLRESNPSRIKISEANLSVPLAIEHIGKVNLNDYGVLPRQVAVLLPERLGEVRTKIADKVHKRLVEKKQNFFLRENFVQDIPEILKGEIKDLSEAELRKITGDFQKIRQEFLSKPKSERATKFIYATRELEKIPRDMLIKLDLKIIVE